MIFVRDNLNHICQKLWRLFPCLNHPTRSLLVNSDTFRMILFQYFYLIFCVYLSLYDNIENHTRNMHFIKAYLQHQDLANKKEVKFYISFEMLRDKITKKIFSFLDLFGLNLWWVKKFDPFSGVTILLSLTVFHNIVTEKLPQVSDAMPLLGIIRIILFIEIKSFLCLSSFDTFCRMETNKCAQQCLYLGILSSFKQ